MDEIETRYYLRFEVNDEPGVLAAIAGALGEQRISVEHMDQESRWRQKAEADQSWFPIMVIPPKPRRTNRNRPEQDQRFLVHAVQGSPDSHRRRRINNQLIGSVNSGLGGWTVVRALREQLPRESIVYLGDTARVPYGTRSAATVLRYARGCSQLLLERGIKVLVIACNTASAVALDVLAAELPIPVIGVVGPGATAAVEAANALRARGVEPVRIGVLGTLSTVESGAYPRAVALRSQGFEVRRGPRRCWCRWLKKVGWTGKYLAWLSNGTWRHCWTIRFASWCSVVRTIRC